MLIKISDYAISDYAYLQENRRERGKELPLSNSGFAPWFWQKTVMFFLGLLTIMLFSSQAWAIRAIGGDRQVRVSWIAPSLNVDGTPLVDLAGYNIYRGMKLEEQTEKINKELLSGCTFVDEGLKNGQTYFYTVKAVDFSGNESPPSEVAFSTPTILPPGGFKAIGDDSKVKLFWEECDNPAVRGYHVYRTQNQGQDYQRITNVAIECTYLEDLNVVNGLNYYYVISSVCEDSKESPYSEERAATPIAPIPVEPSSLKATYELNKVKLEWPPVTTLDSQVAGYHVYRRNSLEEKKFQKLSQQLMTTNTYIDDTIEENMQYLYSVVGVDSQGRESKFPLEVSCHTRSLYIASITQDTEGKAKKAGDKIVIIMRGEPGCLASFTIEGLTENQPMQEEKLGVYHQEYTIQAATNLSGASLCAFLADTQGNKAMKMATGTISIKNDPPPPLLALSAEVNSYGWPHLSWTPPDEKSFSFVEIIRSLSAAEPGFAPESAIPVKKGISSYIDEKADAGAVYYYLARTVDEAGNRSKISDPVKIDLSQNNSSPAIFSVTDDTLGIPVKTGRIIKVSVEADRGCDAFFSFKEYEEPSPDKGAEASSPGRELIQWQPLPEIRPGVYKGEYAVKPKDQTTEKGADLIAKLIDQSKKERFGKGKNLLRINVHSDDTDPPKIIKVEHNGQRGAGWSGKLVAADLLCVRLFGDPGQVAFFSLGPEGKKIPLAESRLVAGEYDGAYPIGYGDEGKDGNKITVYGHLSDQAGNMASKAGETPLSIDTHLIITVTPQQKDLPADNKAQTQIVIKIEDINTNPLSGHHLALTLATTDEYTDVIGGGHFGREIDGKLAIDFEDVTDNFGQIKATYTTGFAAKTALIIAKDLETGQAGVGYITSYIESFLDIMLHQKMLKKDVAPGPGDAASMILEVDPQKITADGRSRARVTVRLLDSNRKPVAKPYRVTFSSSHDEGHLSPRTITTDAAGRGMTWYEAGKRIGTVLITALAGREYEPDKAPRLTENASIILMSDAPAKLLMTADRSDLDADSGQSSSISISVTDINDNPNPEAVVQLRLHDGPGQSSRQGGSAATAIGGKAVRLGVENPSHSSNGELSDTILRTDRNGKTSCTYRAGRSPGLVRIMAKVTSRIPDVVKELRRARGSLFVPLWEEGEETGSTASRWAKDRAKESRGTIREWFKAKGDEIKKGDPLARIEIDRLGAISDWPQSSKARHGDLILRAPANGKLIDIKVLPGEEALIGQTVGFMEIEEE